MNNNHHKLFSTDQLRAIDRQVIASGCASGYELMERAGRQGFAAIEELARASTAVVVLCGTGNNGGDGWIIAREASAAGLQTTVWLVGDERKILDSARKALDSFLAQGGTFRHLDDPGQLDFDGSTLIVDALIGSGFSGELRAAHIAIVDALNKMPDPIVALDCPSGLDANTGMPKPVAVKATITLSFIGDKQGFHTAEAADYLGDVQLFDLDIPSKYLDEAPSAAYRIEPGNNVRNMLRRKSNFHKGLGGHVLVVGGNIGFGGAAILAAESALRVGAGKVTLAARGDAIPAALARCPALMVRTVEDRLDLAELCKAADIVVIGPGLGQCNWARACLQQVLEWHSKVLLDADALNLPEQLKSVRSDHRGWPVVTPHPGEAARLLGVSTGIVGQDRFQAVRQLAELINGTAVLKGAGSLIASCQPSNGVGVCLAGNPYMATAGMGDVLSGLIGGLAAQGLDPERAAQLGVFLHATAADYWVDANGRCLIATDIVTTLPKVMQDWIDCGAVR